MRKKLHIIPICITLCLTLIASMSLNAASANSGTSNAQLTVSKGSEPKYILLSAGKDETSVSVSWYSTSTAPCVLKLEDGEEVLSYQSEVSPTLTPCENEFYQKHVVNIDDLKPGTDYLYTVSGSASESAPLWSETYSFHTKNEGNDFNFLILGDSQQGSNHAEHDAKGWKLCTDKALLAAPDSVFAICMGDIISDHTTMSKMQTQYNSLFYLSETNIFSSVPFVAVVGNHDAWTDDTTKLFTEHFTNPNLSKYGSSSPSVTGEEDFWYTVGNALFMVLNTNQPDTAEHERFIDEAIAMNPGCKWRFVAMHHAIYSTARHSQSKDVLKFREELSPVFRKAKIDVVFQGHDHTYTRSRLMSGDSGTTITSWDAEETRNFYLNPSGTLYLTFNSASGSILYAPKDEYPYVAKTSQTNSANYTVASVKGDCVVFNTYNADNDSLIDRLTIMKQ